MKSSTLQRGARRLFISASPADSRPVARLGTHLAPLVHDGLLDIWHRGMLLSGERIDERVSDELLRADILIAVLSPDYLASLSLLRDVEDAISRNARVVPLLARPCEHKCSVFGALAPLPSDGRPLSVHRDVGRAYVEVVQHIRAIAVESTPARAADGYRTAQLPSIRCTAARSTRCRRCGRSSPRETPAREQQVSMTVLGARTEMR